MNWKKLGILCIFALMLFPLFSALIFAEPVKSGSSGEPAAPATSNTSAGGLNAQLPSWVAGIASYFVPAGSQLTVINLIFGIIAILMMFFILLDIAFLALPFGNFTNYVIVIGLSLGALLLGVVRTIVSFGLTIGSTIAGSAGTFGIIMSSLILLGALFAIFFGGNWILQFIRRAKSNREILENKDKSNKSFNKLADMISGAKTVAKEAEKP